MSSVEKALHWVGSQLVNCPVRDGVTFYFQSEKIFKVIARKKRWHIEFNIPVPECAGLTVLSDEEAKKKKVGKTRWIYKGDSDEIAYQLIQSAINNIPKPRIIDPALTRETRMITRHNCPCLKHIHQIQESPVLTPELKSEVREAYDILQMGDYCDFTNKLYPVFQYVVDQILIKQEFSVEEQFEEKIKILINNQMIPKMLGQEIQSYIERKVFECDFAEQIRAYPVALMLATVTNKLLKLCERPLY